MRAWDVYLLGKLVFGVHGRDRKSAMVEALQYLELVHEDGVEVRPVEAAQ